jgi:hypothetical protein
MELALVEAAVTEVRIGRQAENGFKRESYVRMQMEVNLQNKGKMLEVLQVKSKLALLKKKFEILRKFVAVVALGGMTYAAGQQQMRRLGIPTLLRIQRQRSSATSRLNSTRS